MLGHPKARRRGGRCTRSGKRVIPKRVELERKIQEWSVSSSCITCTSIRIPSRIQIWWSKIREIQQPEWWTQAGTRSLYSGSEATSWISRSMKLRLRRWAPGIKLLHNIRHILKLYGYIRRHTRLVDVTQDLATSVLATSLLVIHDTRTGRLTSIKSKTTS